MPPRARQEIEMVAAVPMRKEGMERPSATTGVSLVQSGMGWYEGLLTGNDGCNCCANAKEGGECICPAQSFAIDEAHQSWIIVSVKSSMERGKIYL
jgi:hypothetical protein